MGLQTTNYTIKESDLLLPNAYAVIRELFLGKDDKCTVYFYIQADRQKCFDKQPLEVVKFKFVHDRSQNVYEEAYRKASEYKEEEVPVYEEVESVDPITNETIITPQEKGTEMRVVPIGPLGGWSDDIVSK